MRSLWGICTRNTLASRVRAEQKQRIAGIGHRRCAQSHHYSRTRGGMHPRFVVSASRSLRSGYLLRCWPFSWRSTPYSIVRIRSRSGRGFASIIRALPYPARFFHGSFVPMACALRFSHRLFSCFALSFRPSQAVQVLKHHCRAGCCS